MPENAESNRSWWGAIIAGAASAYGQTVQADAATAAARAREREQQRGIQEGSRQVWAYLGLAGAVGLIVLVFVFGMRKVKSI